MGVAYLVSVGFLFLGLGLYRLGVTVLGKASPAVGSVVLLVTDLVLVGSLIAVGVWLYSSPLSDERILSVATWGALGLTLPTVVVVVGVVFGFGLREGTEQLLTVFATGGVIGSLYGSVRALDEEHARVTELYRRNQILQRVFRHNIRNGMNVIQGYAQLLAQDAEGEHEEMAETIQREARAVVDLADVARNMDAMAEETDCEPVDLVSVTTELLDTLGRYYPEATFETDLPESAWVAADSSVEIALWHLLEFEIHRSSDCPVSVALSDGDGTDVTLTVEDEGDEIPAEAIEALESGEETPLKHPEGVDLWVVKWLVESIGGTVAVGSGDATGARVSLTFDARSPDTEPGGS